MAIPWPLGFCKAVAIKAFGHERLDVTLGRRGKQVKRSVSCPWPVPMNWPALAGPPQYHHLGDLGPWGPMGPLLPGLLRRQTFELGLSLTPPIAAAALRSLRGGPRAVARRYAPLVLAATGWVVLCLSAPWQVRCLFAPPPKGFVGVWLWCLPVPGASWRSRSPYRLGEARSPPPAGHDQLADPPSEFMDAIVFSSIGRRRLDRLPLNRARSDQNRSGIETAREAIFRSGCITCRKQ